MARKVLLEKLGKKHYSKDIEIFDAPEDIGPVVNPLAWKILKTLNEQPAYPNELAKKLKIHEQNVYYHINKLLKAGLIKIIKEEKKQGAVCRYFAPSTNAFGLELPSKKSEVKLGSMKVNPKLKDFFSDFIKAGNFDGSIVVGAPIPHGPHLTEAQDGHYAAHLAMFLGSLCNLRRNQFTVKLDTEVKVEKKQKRNMILIGGPVTNIICTDLNPKMKVSFGWDKSWYIKSDKVKHLDETAGLIAKIKNPWDKSKSIIILAGVRFIGTKAAIIALTQHYEKILEKFDKHKDFYCVVNGLDRDGDGQIDDIKILE